MDFIKTGDIIGFSGRNWHSAAINVATGGIPFWGISHVGIIGHAKGQGLVLFESATKGVPCEITGKPISGVQAHKLSDVVEQYSGRVWHYSLYRHLYPHESRRLNTFLQSMVGRPYDTLGAIRSGGWLYALANSLLRGQDLSEMFCSEFDAASLSRIGLFPTANASHWNPNRFIRALRRAGIVGRPVRQK
jgi:hypothetical protein